MTTPHTSTTRYNPSEFEPDWAFTPGTMILQSLEDLRFTQADVAARASISAKHLNQVIKAHAPLSPDVAVALERVLGVPAEHWLALEATWQAHKARETTQRSFAGLASWLDSFPAAVLQERNIIDTKATVASRADALLRFFHVADTTAFDKVWLAPQASYKRSQKFAIDPYGTALWLRLAEVAAEASSDTCPSYDASRLRAIARMIPPLTREPIRSGFTSAQALLSKAGVLLVFVPEIADTRITGASRWLTSGHPVIALSGRHKFLDIFWFTLLHEIGHVLLHPKRATYLDIEGVHDDADQREASADSFASELILTDTLREELTELSSDAELSALARRAGVSEGVIAGQYAHATDNWRKFGKLRQRDDLATALR
ncbi:ImmA/IrrE family metallo-endopeptidase [Pseudactinotalea terrae]|uniref:ImmA/IrrE family metallo-endopeptidase n=1 Tax=Pseudactinotalea terrae TaxID=1743262 RepID=UPI0012E20B1B|nr:ImmA/IrrE family metallo-endopeptidase [Pseudactinotalea terrae]